MQPRPGTSGSSTASSANRPPRRRMPAPPLPIDRSRRPAGRRSCRWQAAFRWGSVPRGTGNREALRKVGVAKAEEGSHRQQNHHQANVLRQVAQQASAGGRQDIRLSSAWMGICVMGIPTQAAARIVSWLNSGRRNVATSRPADITARRSQIASSSSRSEETTMIALPTAASSESRR